MIHSMTGMGRAKGKVGHAHFFVEIKSINHRFCEIYTRLPSRLQNLEIPITQLVKKNISRGKVDVSLFEDRSEGVMALNRKALKSYYRFLKEAKEDLHLKDEIKMEHLQAGQSYWMTKEFDDKSDWSVFKKMIEEALQELIQMRKKEGRALQSQILERLKTLENLRQTLVPRRREIVKIYQDKLKKRIAELLQGVEIDASKLANEVAFYADRSDIAEEIDRLSSHVSQMQNLLKSAEPCGRPMDFLIQEMNREWNTIGSKANDPSLTQWVVQAKSELEKIREQIQNIE